MQRSKLPYIFLGLAAVLAISAVVTLIIGSKKLQDREETTSPASQETAPPTLEIGQPDASVLSNDSATVLKDLGVGVATVDPATLVNRIASAMEAGDFDTATRLIGKNTLTPQAEESLRQLFAARPRIRLPEGVREVGELELNARSRWAVELDGQPGSNRVLIDLHRVGRKWSVEKITLPSGSSEPLPQALFTDPLSVADTFLQAVLTQRFETARRFVNPSEISDAKIAALCILFEEGEYRLRTSKPLRSMFQRPDTIGYLANVETRDGQQAAQFSLTLTKPETAPSWLVSEINLDQMLADYARRVAGGDAYYSPLVKNPAGGETLALYFEFDEAAMNQRTNRQLEIVSKILKADPGKNITLSGHTDALGTEDYNDALSARRADVVREYLINAGVSPEQIHTVAKGASQPRRPNVTEAGEDNPEGRRANRRTEIYLDF